MWEMRRRTGPVQQWVDSIPSPNKPSLSITTDHQEEVCEKASTSINPTQPKDIPFSTRSNSPSMTVSVPITIPSSPAISASGLPSSVPFNRLVRDTSLQSDSSHCSSVESLLELRKADPEAILLGLGFGGCSNSPQENGPLSRIPKRFLQPSKLKGIAINDFVKHQQETSESFDSVSLGYRGLTGSPYVAPSEIVQKIMDRLREHESHEIDAYATYNCYDQYSPIQHTGTYSVLSPDNRQFLERPRSKSPDMRNKRMIIGQKSFAFGHDGDLIEIDSPSKNMSKSRSNSNDNNAESPQVHEGYNSKKMTKQLSFDDSMDVCDNNNLTVEISEDQRTLILITDEEGNEKECVSDVRAEENDFVNHTADIRRASDGSCETKILERLSISEGRRHSDSTVHTMETTKSRSALAQRRKTLKRQSKVSDTDLTDCCNTEFFASGEPANKNVEPSSADVTDTHKHNINCIEHKRAEITENDQSKKTLNKSNYCGAECTETLLERVHDGVQTVNNTLLHEAQSQSVDECYEENQLTPKTEEKQICKHGKNCADCCCRSGTKKYWKKMEKILKENKKLESMVVTSRRELAEIREMLTSVISVRMEPGF